MMVHNGKTAGKEATMKLIMTLFAFCAISFSLQAQGLYNNGAKIVTQAGSHVYITGNYRAETNGSVDADIEIDDDFYLGGNFINNVSSGIGFTSLNANWIFNIVGTAPQYWLGVNSNAVIIPNLTFASGSYFDFSGKDMTIAGNVVLNGNTFQAKVGEIDFVIGGNASGSGLFDVSESGSLVMTPSQNVPLFFPIGDGDYNESVTLTCLNVPSQSISIKINNSNFASSYLLWNIEAESNLNATGLFRVDKPAIGNLDPLLNSSMRYFNGSRYIPFSDANVSISDLETYYNITITSINQF